MSRASVPANRVLGMRNAPFSFHAPGPVKRSVSTSSRRVGGNSNCSRGCMLGGGRRNRLDFTTHVGSPMDYHAVRICAARPNVRVCANGFLTSFGNRRNTAFPHHDTMYFRTRGFPSAPGRPCFPDYGLYPNRACARGAVCGFNMRG